jgi:alpha-glucosidase (family GH31 glycosyl hydrolase)
MGVDGFKTDGSEAVFGRDVQFADGRTGDEMHNAYPNEYTGAYADYVSEKVGSEGALFSRAGTSGAQANSIFWAGDQSSSFGAFQEAVRAGQSAGQSGIPFWSWDLAGFTGSFPSAELYLRSAAQATFSPVMQYHSEKADPVPSEARTPWNVQARSGNTSVVPTFSKFANVRMNLLPYTYTEASNSAATGAPMMQAMAYAYPGDSQAAARDQQYLYGRNLLVAPITSAGATSKELYLPAGEWYDLWNGGRALGGTKTYSAGLDTIPVYAKAGAVLPLNLNASYELGGAIGNSVDNYTNLTFRVYPSSAASSYGYFDDSAGVTKQITQVADRVGNTVTVGLPALATKSTLQVSGTKPSGVSNGGAAITSGCLGCGPRRRHSGLVLGRGTAAHPSEDGECGIRANDRSCGRRQSRIRGRVWSRHGRLDEHQSHGLHGGGIRRWFRDRGRRRRGRCLGRGRGKPRYRAPLLQRVRVERDPHSLPQRHGRRHDNPPRDD